MKKVKKKLVEVTWQDIQTHGGWQDGTKPMPYLKAYGLLVHKDKEVVTLATCYDRETDKWSDTMDFPKGCVKSIRIIETVEV